MKMQPLILTLRLDEVSQAKFDALRRQHFPLERNYLDAHLTLFHALPAASEARIRADLDEMSARTPPLQLRYPKLRFLGKGSAIEVEAPALVELRHELSTRWHDLLGAQDARVIKPHITIQNKVAPAPARALFDELSSKWQPFEGWGQGLQLWRYQGGPWQAAGDWQFAGAVKS